MTTMLIAQNETVESGSFMGDQLCSLKTAYLMVLNQPGVDRVLMSVSPGNQLHFLWTKFIERFNIELIHDDWNPGDWPSRHGAWDRWRRERKINGIPFDHYRELYLRIHGAMRQLTLCGHERGLGRKNIYEYWLAGQENAPDTFPGADWFDDSLIHHPPLTRERDVYISPHCKTQGNITFTFDFWSDVVHRLVDAGVSVTVGYDGYFCQDLVGHPCYKKHWGNHREWMEQVCRHKLVACGNTGTGWLAAACGTPMITMEPHNSCMPDHRYRECGLKNIVEVVDGFKLDELNNDMARVAQYVSQRIIEEVKRCVVMTTGCYDILHAGHIRHLERSRVLGTKLIVALNSDQSVKSLKGPERPINPQNQRKAVLEAIRFVDEVRIFDGHDASDLIRELRPDVLACGFGYTPEKIIGRDIVESYGGKVAITCPGDARDEPSTTKIVRRLRAADVHAIIRAGAPYSVNPLEKLRLMAEEFLSVAHLPGDVADLGTYRGGTALILRRLAPEKAMFIFDTWEGNPYDDPLCHHRKGEWACSLDDCVTLVGKSHKTAFVKGIFPSSMHGMDCCTFCFVYVDMDTYQSTKDALEWFWPRMVPGGKILIDDFGWEPCRGTKKAVDEMFTESQRRVVESQYACIIEKK